ncbi:MAG: hypothetical protein M4D80_30530 [Myxococcota bacterium]|nr:hypothetical protein [Deltaproteobacteria bacterium]MDQ3339523.1 hypothetical protein [Myxococcota bacterium]
MASRIGTLTACALLSGCLVGDTDDDDCTVGKCDGDGNSCSDKRYGNGTCDLQLDCAAPDIDCFVTFDDDAAAATWFAEFEAKWAEEEHREPRKLLGPSDPRWAKTRALLDDGWAAFKANRPVGELREKRPGLVLLDDSAPNAFVAPDLHNGNAGFAVMVQTGLFETGGSQDGAMGVMMHEFQHVIGLHIVGDTKERTRKFYFAGIEEPLGKFETDDMVARRYGETWLAHADDVGRYREAALRGLPMDGQLVQMLQAAVGQAGTMQVPACLTARMNLSALANEIAGTADPITGEIVVAANVPSRVDQVMGSLKSACFANFNVDFIGVVAAATGVTAAAIEAQMMPSDVALVKGKHVVDGFIAIVSDRRAQMRTLEAELASKVGKQWSKLRYFSTEEDADDVSVLVLRGAKIQPDAIGPFFVSFLLGDGPQRCTAMLARRELPPYGQDLTDDHHSTCWRAHHVRQLAEHDGKSAHVAKSPMPSVAQPRRLPIPRPLRERVAY